MRIAVSARSDTAQNRKRDHPRPPLLETTRVDGVKAPQHRGTPGSASPPSPHTKQSASHPSTFQGSRSKSGVRPSFGGVGSCILGGDAINLSEVSPFSLSLTPKLSLLVTSDRRGVGGLARPVCCCIVSCGVGSDRLFFRERRRPRASSSYSRCKRRASASSSSLSSSLPRRRRRRAALSSRRCRRCWALSSATFVRRGRVRIFLLVQVQDAAPARPLVRPGGGLAV